MPETSSPSSTLNTTIVPSTPFQNLLSQYCTPPEGYGDHYLFDRSLLPVTVSDTFSTSLCRYRMGGKEGKFSQNTGYLELSSNKSSLLLMIGDVESQQDEAFFTWPLQLSQVLERYNNSIKTIEINQDVTVAVQILAQGHPCNGTDKSLHLKVAAHRQINDYYLVAFKELQITDTSEIEDLLQKYATPHTPSADDICEFGQRYNFNDFENSKTFSVAVADRFFGTYPEAAEPYKAMIDDAVAEVMAVSEK